MPNESVNASSPGDAKTGDASAVIPAKLLPEGARLLHIGQPDAAVVDMQNAAAARRELLLENGVLYPGHDLDHSAPASTLIGPSSPAWRATRTLAAWDGLRSELEAHPRARALISDEHIAACDDATARRFAEELGRRLHVVITARGVREILPTLWQNDLLAGGTALFRKWMDRAFDRSRHDDEKAESGIPEAYDLSTQTVRWAKLIGPARVHVVLIDDDNPMIVSRAFESLLGLPADALAPEGPVERESVRDLSPTETNVIRRLNSDLRSARLTTHGGPVVRDGAIAALRACRQPSEREGRLEVPSKHDDQLENEARAFVDGATSRGIEVVGAVDRFLSPPVRARSTSRPIGRDHASIATAMLRGAVSAALERGTDFEMPAPDPHPLGQETQRPRRGRARDVLHVDLSSRRVIDRIRPAAPGASQPSLVGRVARVVASSRTARWVGVEGYALVDADLRERVFGALNDPKVVITADSGAERALWEQAVALGETRGFPEWSVDGDALLAAIAEHADDVSVIRAEDDDAIREAIQGHPANLQWDPRASGKLSGAEVLMIRNLNSSLADVDLQPFERLAVIGAGAMGGMRAQPAREKNRADPVARALVGIAALVAQHSAEQSHD